MERVFYVDGFNPVARWSMDLIDVVCEVADGIFNQIRKNDIKNMWDDFDLISKKGMSINQIRELSPRKGRNIEETQLMLGLVILGSCCVVFRLIFISVSFYCLYYSNYPFYRSY